MKNLILTAVAFLFAFVACDKFPDELILTVNEAGVVKIKVIDNDKKEVAGAEVVIRNYSGNELSKGVTNASGVYTPEKLLQGSYYCAASVTKGKVTYQADKRIQIIAGETKNVEINPFSNTGKVSVQLIDMETKQPMPNMNVSLCPDNLFELTVWQYIDASHFYEKTDADGWAYFTELPINAGYCGLFYNDTYSFLGLTHGQYRYPFYVNKGAETKIVYEIYTKQDGSPYHPTELPPR